MRQSIVTYGGNPDGLGPIYNMSFSCPAIRYLGALPSRSQREAVQSFFGFEVERESECQVHALLTYRDYARLAARRLYPFLSQDRQMLLARAIAAFISHDRQIRSDVMRWASRRWRAGSNYESAESALHRTKHYTAVEEFACALLFDMSEAGAPIWNELG